MLAWGIAFIILYRYCEMNVPDPIMLVAAGIFALAGNLAEKDFYKKE